MGYRCASTCATRTVGRCAIDESLAWLRFATRHPARTYLTGSEISRALRAETGGASSGARRTSRQAREGLGAVGRAAALEAPGARNLCIHAGCDVACTAAGPAMVSGGTTGWRRRWTTRQLGRYVSNHLARVGRLPDADAEGRIPSTRQRPSSHGSVR